jgi:hypothetical protein
VVMGAFHRWWSWESGAHGHAYLTYSSSHTSFVEEMDFFNYVKNCRSRIW